MAMLVITRGYLPAEIFTWHWDNPFGSIWWIIVAECYPGTYPIRPIPKVLEWAYQPIPRISHCYCLVPGGCVYSGCNLVEYLSDTLVVGLKITKGSVSYLSSPCFSTSLGGIGGPAHGIHGILAVMYWISIIRGPPPRKWSWVQFPRVTRSRAPTLEAHFPWGRCPCSPA